MTGGIGDVNQPAQPFQRSSFVDGNHGANTNRDDALAVSRRVNGVCHRSLTGHRAYLDSGVRYPIIKIQKRELRKLSRSTVSQRAITVADATAPSRAGYGTKRTRLAVPE